MIANSTFNFNDPLAHPTEMAQARIRLSLIIMRVVSAIFFIAGTSVFFVVPQDSDWKYYAIALGLNILGGLIIYTTSEGVPDPRAKLFRFQIFFHLGVLFTGLLISGISLFAALLSLLFSILISSIMLAGSDSEAGVTIGIVSAFIILAGSVFMTRVQIPLPLFQIFLPPLVGVLIISYMAMISLGIVSVPLRIKLIIASLVMVTIPLVILSIVSTTSSRNSISTQRNENLVLAAERTASAVDNFILSNLNAVEEDSKNPLILNYLAASESGRAEQLEGLKITFAALNQRSSGVIRSIGLLDTTGINIYDTDQARINQLESFSDYFIEAFARKRSFVSEIRFSEVDNKPNITMSSPIVDGEANSQGVLRVILSADAIQTVLEANTNLAGPNTRPLLLDENQVRLADTYNSTFIYKSLAPLTTTQLVTLKITGRLPNLPDALLSTNMTELSTQLASPRGKKFFTAVMTTSYPETQNTETITTAHLTTKPWTVLYTQRTALVQSLIEEQTTLSWLITTIIAFLTTIAATVIARTISNPVTRLTETAQVIVSGKLDAVAEVTTTDEVGTLASMFNTMTSQLRTSINELEDRVADRTRELDAQNKSLAYRSRQIETIAEVARGITSTQDLEKLLTLVTELVSQRFGFYHAGIFLLDEKKQFAVLRAANSTGGKRMLARQHKLKVGQVGIVGYATGNAAPRIATDVGEDAVYFNNPDLPLTRSEMALPLIASGEVIGALDIQSVEPNAFSNQDIELFSTLADQVAVGIINSRLFDDTQKALEDAQAVHRQYLKQEWVRQAAQQPVSGYQYVAGSLLPITGEVEPELQTVLQSGQTVTSTAQQEASGTASLGVPIILKGQVIGAIQLQDSKEGGREWNETEIAAARAVADQIAQALENARLFEQTARRAERERKVLEITSKIRATNDPQAMLDIAVAEVQQALGASRVQVVFSEAGLSNNGSDPSAH